MLLSYFTDGLRIYKKTSAKKPESMTHSFVLTDISGGRSYASCLTFYRLFSVTKVTINYSPFTTLLTH